MTNVPDKLKHLEDLTPDEIERRCLQYEKMDPSDVNDDMLEEVVALMTIHRRKTAGPAKPKSAKPSKKVSLADFLGGM
jgi:hypothetical protein